MSPAWRRYGMVAAFAVLMLMPQPAAVAILIGAALATTAARITQVLTVRRALNQPSKDALALGTDSRGRVVHLGDEQLAAHGLILGASGAGKSTTLLRILGDQISRGRPVVVIDLKGSVAFARSLASAAAGAGRPFMVWTPDGPRCWNPLQYGNATQLKDKLIATERFTEPHYQRAAERYVQTVLQVLGAQSPRRAPTLHEVVALMDPARLGGALRGLPGTLTERVQDYLTGMTPDQLSAVRGLATRLAILTEAHTGEYLRPPSPAGETIDLRRALDGDQVVLFSLNSSSYGHLAAQLGTLAVQDIVSAVGERLQTGAGGMHAIVAIDEFSALGGDQVISLLARARESGVSVLLATQEMADLDRAGAGVRDQVIGVTAVKIVHRQEVPGSARMVAEMAGTVRVWEETRQVGGRLLGGYDTGRGTRRRVEQYVVHPNEIKALTTGQAVLITKLPRAQVRVVDVVAPAVARGVPPVGGAAGAVAGGAAPVGGVAPAGTATTGRAPPATAGSEWAGTGPGTASDREGTSAALGAVRSGRRERGDRAPAPGNRRDEPPAGHDGCGRDGPER